MGSGPLNPLVSQSPTNATGSGIGQQPLATNAIPGASPPLTNTMGGQTPLQASSGSTAPYMPLSGLGLPMTMGGGSLGSLGSNSTIAPGMLRTK